jgi:DNA-directed RNA polymerase beta subunit
MIGSSPCFLSDGMTSEDKNLSVDPRGYFIVEGQEKVCIAQEKPRYNRVFVYRDQPKTPFKAEIRSMHEFKIRSTSTLVVYCCRTQANDRYQVKLPYLDLPVRIDAILRMLGYESPEQAALAVASWGMISGFTASPRMDEMQRSLAPEDYRVYRYFLNALQNDVMSKGQDVWSMSYVETAQMIARLGSKSKQSIATDPVEQFKHVHHLMGNEFLPHIGYKHEHETRVRKRRFFAMMMARLCRVSMGLLPPDDREFYGNKLIETSGWLMSLYYRQLCRHVCRKILNYIRKCVKKGKTPDVAEYVASTTSKKMSENFRYSIATGKWGIKRKRVSTHAVVTQQMKRMVFMATLGNLRKINTPMSHKGRNPKPRQLHYSQHGIVCLAKTPEGAPVGLLKNLAMGARISSGCMSHVVMTAIANRRDLMEMIETFPGSEFNYDMGGLAALPDKNIFAVPS